MHHPTDRISHTTAFVTSVVEHWHERENAQWDRSDERTLLPRSYVCIFQKQLTYTFIYVQ